MIEKCKKHPKYKAIRKPTVDCRDCKNMWLLKRVDELLNVNKQLQLQIKNIIEKQNEEPSVYDPNYLW